MSNQAGSQPPKTKNRSTVSLLARVLSCSLPPRAPWLGWGIPLAIVVLAFSYPW